MFTARHFTDVGHSVKQRKGIHSKQRRAIDYFEMKRGTTRSLRSTRVAEQRRQIVTRSFRIAKPQCDPLTCVQIRTEWRKEKRDVEWVESAGNIAKTLKVTQAVIGWILFRNGLRIEIDRSSTAKKGCGGLCSTCGHEATNRFRCGACIWAVMAVRGVSGWNCHIG